MVVGPDSARIQTIVRPGSRCHRGHAGREQVMEERARRGGLELNPVIVLAVKMKELKGSKKKMTMIVRV